MQISEGWQVLKIKNSTFCIPFILLQWSPIFVFRSFYIAVIPYILICPLFLNLLWQEAARNMHSGCFSFFGMYSAHSPVSAIYWIKTWFNFFFLFQIVSVHCRGYCFLALFIQSMNWYSLLMYQAFLISLLFSSLIQVSYNNRTFFLLEW